MSATALYKNLSDRTGDFGSCRVQIAHMGIYKQKNGKWRVRWTDEHGDRQSEVFDTREDAKFANTRNQSRVEEVRRGLRGLSIPKKTFTELCEYWLKYRSPQKRNPRDDLSVIRAHLRPYFGDKLLLEIRKSDFDGFIISKQHLSKKTVSNILTLLISMLNAAVQEGWLRTYPKIKKPRTSIFSKDFSYLKNNEEVHRFLAAAKAESNIVYTMYATAVYTGMRQGEIASLRRSDIDLVHRQITVQRSFNGPTKSDLIRRVPILDVLVPILKDWLSRTPGDIVFPSQSGKQYGEAARIFQEVFHRVLDRAQFPKTVKHGRTRRYIVFHDLRHTFASHWMMKGGQLLKLRDVLGHQNITITQRYAHMDPGAFVADYSRFNALSTEHIENVVPFKVNK